MANKNLKIGDYQIDKVLSYEKKINKKVAKDTKGLIKVYKHRVIFDNETCSYINYIHEFVEKEPRRTGNVQSHLLDHISSEDSIEQIDNIYFVHKPNSPKEQYYIYSKDKDQEYSYLYRSKVL